MSLDRSLEDLRARVALGSGSATLLLVVVANGAGLDDVRQLLCTLLSGDGVTIVDLGTGGSSSGPSTWAEQTQGHPAAAFVLSIVPETKMEAAAFAKRANAERSLLQRLPGPVVLVVSQHTEMVLRRLAHDFVTWVAHSYAVDGPKALRSAAQRLGVENVEPIEPEVTEEPVRFLHISDLHLRPGAVRRYDQDRVLRGLLEHLEHDHERFALDLVFITGDLGATGRPEEYELVSELLRQLLEVTKVDASRAFVVPGNHDVDRSAGRWLKRTLDPGDADAFFVDPRARRFHREKLGAYESGLRPLLGHERELGLGVGAHAVELVEVRGARIAIASFNTAWFCQGDEDRGKLWLGEPNVEHAVDRIVASGADVSLALMHHPFEYLHEHERMIVERWFERGFDLVLRGHLHHTRTQSIATQRGGYVEVAAPATYQGSQWGNGCFLGEVRAKARTIRLRPLRYASGPDPWVLDPSVFPHDEADGYCRTFSIPREERRRSAASPAMRKTVEEAYEKASPRQKAIVEETLHSTRNENESRSRQLRNSEATTALVESPSLVHEVMKGDIGYILVSAIERHNVEPISSIPDRESFARALAAAGRLLVGSLAETGISRRQLTEPTFIHSYAAALGLVTGIPLGLDVAFMGGRADIVMGREPPLDMLELSLPRTHASHRLSSFELKKIEQVRGYLRLGHFRFGALVLLHPRMGRVPSASDVEQRVVDGRTISVLWL